MPSVCRELRRLSPLISIICGLALILAAWLVPVGRSHSEGLLPHVQFPTEGRATDCGAVALFFIAKLQGRDCKLAELQTLVKTSVIGTDMLSLRDGARTLNFKVDGVRLSFDQMREYVSKPGHYAILHSPVHSHFLAVVGRSEPNAVQVADTVLGAAALNETDLDRTFGWDGAALLLSSEESGPGAP